jgi:hypothetical protein
MLLQFRGNNANHMVAFIFEIILLRACENMENVNTQAHKNIGCTEEHGLS